MKHKPDVDELGELVTTYHKTNKHPVETGFWDSFFYLPYALTIIIFRCQSTSQHFTK